MKLKDERHKRRTMKSINDATYFPATFTAAEKLAVPVANVYVHLSSVILYHMPRSAVALLGFPT